MSLKKIVGKVHLWLGFVSGIIVFIVGITGSVFVFKEEIEGLLGTSRFIKIEQQPATVLYPSELKKICEDDNPQGHASSVEYPGSGYAAIVAMENERNWWEAYFLNPYSGEIIRRAEPGGFNFFDWCLRGHRWLWFSSYEVGHTVVNYVCILFIISLITGLVLWWPKNKAARKQRLQFSWKPTTKWKRKNYDLHNVLGFYVMAIALILAVTGVVFGIRWFHDGYYYLLSGGDTLEEVGHIASDTTQQHRVWEKTAEDLVWEKLTKENPGQKYYIEVMHEENPEAFVFAMVNQDNYRFDRYTMQEMKFDNPLYGKLGDAPLSAKILRLNYEIHIGAIGGLPTKILAFFGSLIVASLPVTGVLIWWGRRKKTIKKPARTLRS